MDEIPPLGLAGLIMWGRQLLKLNDRDLAQLLDKSLRSVERHNRNGGVAGMDELRVFLGALHPVHPELARRIAEAAGTNLLALGLEGSTPEQRAAARQGNPATPREAFSVVSAAAELLGLGIEETMPAVQAAFVRAHALGLSVEALLPMLGPPKRRK